VKTYKISIEFTADRELSREEINSIESKLQGQNWLMQLDDSQEKENA
jgi:uncharacterized protein YcgL (UPF0745 family)